MHTHITANPLPDISFKLVFALKNCFERFQAKATKVEDIGN